MASLKFRLPVYSIVSASHRRLNEEFFLPSLERTASEKIEIRQREVPQVAHSGRFRETGWKDQTLFKVEWMLQAACESEVFVFSDVDVVFLRPWVSKVLKALDRADLYHMREPTFCPAFLVMRSTTELHRMLESILDGWGQWPGDGMALLEQIPMFGIKVAPLSDSFSNPGLLGFPIPIQDGKLTFSIPVKTCAFHANFRDISQKPALLSGIVRQSELLLGQESSGDRPKSWWRRGKTEQKPPAAVAGTVCEPGKFPTSRPNRPFDRHSMMSRAKFRDLLNLVGDHPVRLIVEIGSWLGSSTRWFLETFGLAVQSGQEHLCAEVVSIDTWTGLPEYGDIAELAYRLPYLWEQWCANCWEWRHCITPVRMLSKMGVPAIAGELARQSRSPDLVFIDGDHNEESCFEDIRLCSAHWPRALILGDDYLSELPTGSGQYPVIKAVNRASRDFNLTLTVGESGIWRLLPAEEA